MNGFATADFWFMFLLPGGIGWFSWMLMTFKAKDDDRLGSSLRQAFGEHSRTLALSGLAHLVMCVLLHEEVLSPVASAIGFGMKLDLNIVTALVSGYGANSVAFKVLGLVPKKIKDRIDSQETGGDK